MHLGGRRTPGGLAPSWACFCRVSDITRGRPSAVQRFTLNGSQEAAVSGELGARPKHLIERASSCRRPAAVGPELQAFPRLSSLVG